MTAAGFAAGIWPVYIAALQHQPLLTASVTAHVTGMLAGYGVLVMIVLMARWPVLELGVGADRLARWHSAGGRVVVSLVLIHATAATIAWAQAQGLTPAAAAVDVLEMPYLISAAIGTTLLLAVAAMSARSARRNLSYEQWHAIHLLTYLAVALSFLHQLAGPDLAGHLVVQVAWALMYCHAFALILRYRVVAPVEAFARHQLQIKEVRHEAPGVVSLVLGGTRLTELRAEPGQFFRWRFLTPTTWGRAHPFSLSAPPNDHELRLTIKSVGEGTRGLQGLQPGTWVVAEGPYGAMTAARRRRRDAVLIAGGVGITPLRALFETLPVSEDQDLLLLYRASRHEEIIFRTEIDALAHARKAHVIYLLGDRPGLLSASTLNRLVPGLSDRDVYLCGSPGMTAAVRESLRQVGLPPRQLHEERFVF